MRLLFCIVMPALFAGITKAADVSALPFITSGSTLTNAATWTVGTSVVIDRQTQAGLAVKFQGDGSSTSDIVCTLARSWDGTNFETSPPSTLKFTNALANTTAVVAFHQIPREVIGSAYSLKLVSIVNAASSVKATNATVALVKKRELP